MQKIYVTGLYVSLGVVSLLALITLGRGRFVKRKMVISTMIFVLTGAAAGIPSCGTVNRKDQIKVNDTWVDKWKFQGWVDNDTFRIIGAGESKPGMKDEKKKEYAKRSAVLNAQYYMKEKIQPEPNAACCGMGRMENPRVIQELNGIIKGGTVIEERYDREFNCEIIYEIKHKNLKSLTREAYRD